MASVTIRNLDEDVVKALKEKAKRNNRSLEGEIRTLLSDAAKRPARQTQLVEIARRIAAMTPDVPQTDSTDLIREDRDRR